MRSLASSITTLFPLITTIPILFCVFWGRNIQVKKLKCLRYKHTKVNVIRGCATYLFGELNGVIQHQVHEGVKTAESPFNLENISVSNTSLKFFHHSSPTTDYLIIITHMHIFKIIPSPHLTATVDPEVNPLVHELLQLRRVGLRHLSWIEREI